MNHRLEKNLIQILEKEVEVYDRILSVKMREKEALLDFSTPALENCTLDQDQLAREAAELEYRRRAVVREMVETRGVSIEDPSLREVIEWLSPAAAGAASDLRLELKDLLVEIASLQDANAGLIEGANRFIRRLIDSIMARTKEDPFAYGRGGKKASLREPVPGLLDRKA